MPDIQTSAEVADARLEFANGCVANVIASRISWEKMRRIRVLEPQRYESLDVIERRLEVAYPQELPHRKWPEIVTERVQIEPVKLLGAQIDVLCARRTNR